MNSGGNKTKPERIMKKNVLKWFNSAGKLSVPILVVLQTIILSRYPSIYWENKLWNLMLLLMLPTLIIWYIHKKKTHEEQIKGLWLVWLIYIVTAFMPMIGVVFGGVRSKLDRNQFFGPNNLTITMCLTPGIALFLFITTSEARKYHSALIRTLCGDVAVDLFDYVEILAALLPQTGSDPLPDGIAGPTIAFVFASLLLSVLEIGENKLSKDGTIGNREKLYLWRLILKIPVNFTLLVIRLILWLEYKHNASIFIAKNLIIILIMIYNIVLYYLDDDEKEKPNELRDVPNDEEAPKGKINAGAENIV